MTYCPAKRIYPNIEEKFSGMNADSECNPIAVPAHTAAHTKTLSPNKRLRGR